MQKSILNLEIVKQEDNGGEIVISTPALDRDSDRVLPQGAKTANYLKNPVVQWGHNYRDPWATVGKTTSLEVGTDGLKAKFEFREAANESDPLHIIKSLWNGGFVNTASIGFNPVSWEENDAGGFDFTEWELLEWSLVPIPANQEALRLAVKALREEAPQFYTTDAPTVVYVTEKTPRGEEPDYSGLSNAIDNLIEVLRGK